MRKRTVAWLCGSVVAGLLLCPCGAQEPKERSGRDVLVVVADLTLEAGAVLRTPLRIAGDGVVVDGNGATIEGPGKPGDRDSFAGTGVLIEGRTGVTIRNLAVRGFERGLVATSSSELTIEGCDLSDNFHDPHHGWGDGERNGGFILTAVQKSSILRCRANGVWNGLDLWECDDNVIAHNDLSHCSNVCLKLWRSSRNRILDNNLSWGLRMDPGEVHARDSTSVLIETGSNDNRFERNDCSHGGDGIFIRPLNGWVSTGNVFVENDCSYANNNGFESWSPGNTFIRNRANHCSFGFWLGGSDATVLLQNEASYNGLPSGKHNAPEPDFRHGGIVIVGGQGHHTVIDGNRCVGNNGAGIVFRGDLATRGDRWRMENIIVQRNVLEENEWGLFARFTDGLFLSSNVFRENRAEDEHLEDVRGIVRGKPDAEGSDPPKVELRGATVAVVGETVVFDAAESADPSGRPLTFSWRVGEHTAVGPRVEHVFDRPGFYRVWVLATNGHLAGRGFLNVYAVDASEEPFTEGSIEPWTVTPGPRAPVKGLALGEAELDVDGSVSLVGRSSVRVSGRPGLAGGPGPVVVGLGRPSGSPRDLSGTRAISFWVRVQTPSNGGLGGPHPVVRLHSGRSSYTYLPARDGRPVNLLRDLPYAEARYGWLRFEVPLAGGDGWIRSESLDGEVPPHVDSGLLFETVRTPMAADGDSGLVATGDALFYASRDDGRLWRSENGREWTERRSPAGAIESGWGDWYNGMLAGYRDPKGRELLVLRFRERESDEHGQNPPRYVTYDVARDQWQWTPTYATATHGTVAVGSQLWGIAASVGGNYGGPIVRVDLGKSPEIDERTVLGGIRGAPGSRWWFSRAAKLALHDGLIYGIKNDWVTPAPEGPDETGDRLFVVDPEAYRPSDFAGGFPWREEAWKASETPARDLGALPFEPGHGSALVALPPRWCASIGEEGGLLVVAGCSPSDHEGFGPPSDRFALYDVATGTFTLGRLPAPTGGGTSAAFHDGKVFIKRGGLSYGPDNGQLWIVDPVTAERAAEIAERATRERVRLNRVERVTWTFDAGGAPFTVWLDGLRL